MRKTLILMVLVILVIYPNCKNSGESGVAEIVLEEKPEPANVKLVFEKKVELPNMIYPTLHKAGSEIYVRGYSTEKRKKVILNIYNDDLALSSQKEFFMGLGPGDLGEGSFIFKFDDHIYVPSNTQMRVNTFDKAFNFIKFVPLTKQIFLPVTFIKNGEYFLGTTPTYTERSEVIYQFYTVKFPELVMKRFQSLGPVNPWSSSTNSKKLVIGAVPEFHYFYKNENIYFINMDDYQLRQFDMGGQLLKKVRVNVDKKKVPEGEKISWLKYQEPALWNRIELVDDIQPACWMVPLGKGFAVIRREGYGDQCNGLVEADFFDYQLNLKGKLKIPCFYAIFKLRRGYFMWTYQYHEGYLYLVNEVDDTYYLEKWKVIE